MPTYPGLITPVSAYREPPSWQRSSEISEYSVATYPAGHAASSIASSGAKTDTQPVDEFVLSRGGASQPAFGADWYHRIHVIPSRIDLGNLVSTVQRTIEVWNAFFSAQTLNAINETGTDGLAVTGQPATPLSFGLLQSRLYTLEVSISGAPIIDAEYRFAFAGGVTVYLTVTGRRVVVFGMRPDWSGGITERLEWLTEVMESYDGTEQRVRLRQIPRRGFEYAFIIAGHDARVLDNLLYGWGGRTYCLPVWTDISILTSDVPAGSTTLIVQDAANSDYHAGGMAVLWRSNTQNEAVEIISIAGNTLTLKLPLGATWPAGTRVFPARLARLEGEITVARPTDTIATGRCRFGIEDVTAPTVADYGQAYQGYQVFDWKPDRSADIEDSWARKLAAIDYGTGPRTFDDESGLPHIGHTLTWLLPDRNKVAAFRGWLAARAGRANPCWLPTFETDLEITQTVADSDGNIVVRNVGYARFVAADPLRRDIMIVTTAGTFHRRITGAFEVSDDEETVSIDAPLGVTINPDQVLQVSYLELARLDQDSVELFWETDAVARVQLSTRTIRQ